MKKNHSTQSVSSVFANFVWIFKRIIKYSPGLLLDKIIRIPVSVLSAYISVNLTRWILDWVQMQTDLRTIITYVLLVFSFIIVANFILAILSILFVPQKKIDFGYRMRAEVIGKIKRIDQINFQNTSFFNSYTLGLKEIDNRAIAVLDCTAAILTSIISFLIITGVTGSINSGFARLGVIATVIDVSLGVLRQKIKYKQTLEATPDGRKREYIGRVTYQPEFASDLKIYPSFSSLLLYHYKQATQRVKTIILSFSRKILIIDQCQQVPSVVLRQVIPWILVVVLLKKGDISIPESTVLLSAALTIPNTLTTFLNGISSSFAHSLYIDNLKKILNFEERIECESGVVLDEASPVNIGVNDISFSYDSNTKTIDGVSLSIHPGEKVSIVGYNGAGKSTLVKLLVRLFDVGSGAIMINGREIREYSTKSLRSRIACVSQEYKIYSFSIAENILMRPVESQADIEMVNEALKKVGLYEKVNSFATGIDTFITREFEESGQYLSGGEIQKLVLARIYVGNYDCIILDESTSSLDPVSESEILDTIFEIFKDKTVIMISHRLATIKYTDTVYFLEKGKIIESGSHQQLMKLHGKYSEYYLTQANKYETNP